MLQQHQGRGRSQSDHGRTPKPRLATGALWLSQRVWPMKCRTSVKSKNKSIADAAIANKARLWTDTCTQQSLYSNIAFRPHSRIPIAIASAACDKLAVIGIAAASVPPMLAVLLYWTLRLRSLFLTQLQTHTFRSVPELTYSGDLRDTLNPMFSMIKTAGV